MHILLTGSSENVIYNYKMVKICFLFYKIKTIFVDKASWVGFTSSITGCPVVKVESVDLVLDVDDLDVVDRMSISSSICSKVVDVLSAKSCGSCCNVVVLELKKVLIDGSLVNFEMSEVELDDEEDDDELNSIKNV